MFINFTESKTTDRLGRTWKRCGAKFQCDQCFKQYESKNLKRDLSRERNYCSKPCSDEAKKPGMLSHKAFRETNQLRYGVNSPVQNKLIHQKMKATNMERYGTSCTFGNQNVQQQAIKTRLLKYNVEYSAQIPGVMEKVAATNIKKYGTVNPMNSPDIMSTYDYDSIYQKRLLTMKSNKTIGCRISLPEQHMYKLLLQKFSESDVKTQVKVIGKRWCIDFYITSIDVWIQVDGVYWHGLDRDIELVKSSQNKQGQAIYKKWLSDRAQDAWFAENNMKLVRFTDVQVNSFSECPDL
jgi:hypothetical protein